jgi:hypothetical protein
MLFVLALHSLALTALAPDPTWAPVLPAGLSATKVSALAVDDRPRDKKRSPIVFIGQRGAGAPPILAFAHNGTYLRGFGKGAIKSIHGMALQPSISKPGLDNPSLWITDTGDHTLRRFNVASGALEVTLGTAGQAGNGTYPLQFGSVADVAFDASGALYVSDGDGGVNNRVLKIGAASEAGGGVGARYAVVWVAGNGGDVAGDFSSPHSLTYESSVRGGRLWVADRNNCRVLALDAGTGRNQTALAIAQHCFPGAAADGAAPWSVRVDGTVLAVAVAHSPAKGYKPTQARIVELDVGAPRDPSGCPPVVGSYAIGSMPAAGEAFQWTLHEIASDSLASPRRELYGAVVDAPWAQATVRFAATAKLATAYG